MRGSRPRERRGIILIFVVVLLMLLAIMGTAYLAVSRADRLALTGRGALPGATAPPQLVDRTRLDALLAAGEVRVRDALIEDLFNVAPGALAPLRADALRGVTGTQNELFAAFRQEMLPGLGNGPGTANVFYENYDAPGRADPFLASLLPEQPGGQNTPIFWPWISAPLQGELTPGVQLQPFFSDPRYLERNTGNGFRPTFFFAEQPAGTVPHDDALRNTSVDQRRNIQILERGLPMVRPANATAGQTDNTRVYPAFAIPAPVMAADADGEGIADAGMMPIAIHPNLGGVDQYLDRANGVVYFLSYRVVDESAKVNATTALTAKYDFALTSATTPVLRTNLLSVLTPTAPDRNYTPNLGFSKSNVGLIELVRNTLAVYDGGGAGGAVTTPEIRRLLDVRFPVLTSGALTKIDSSTAFDTPLIARLGLENDPFAPTTPPADVVARYSEGTRNVADPRPAQPRRYFYEYPTFGTLLEGQLHRRPESPGGLRTSPSELDESSLALLPPAEGAAMASRGGTLLNPQLTPGAAQTALLFTTQMLEPNFAGNNEPAWRYFPPTESDLWFGWTKDFAPTAGPATPTGYAANTALANPTQFRLTLLDEPLPGARQYSFNPSAATGLQQTSLNRPLRPLLTTLSGTTALVPMRRENGGGPPKGMPIYGPLTSDQSAYPAVRVAAATGTKEQLWRAYWSAMTQNDSGNSWVPDRDLRNILGDPIATGQGRPLDVFAAPDRHASRPADDAILAPNEVRLRTRLNEQQMTLIRSALAACNTVDLRDTDDDITAMTVDLGEMADYGPGANVPTNDREGLFARVYGTEKQLVITGVVIDDNDDGNSGDDPFVAVEIFNPSDEPIDLRGYYLGVVQRYSPPSNNLTSGTMLTDGLVTSTTEETDQTIARTHLLPTGRSMDVPALLAPGGFLIVTNDRPVPDGIEIPSEQPELPTTIELDPAPTAPAPQVIRYNDALALRKLLALDDEVGPSEDPNTAPLNRELVLWRTRRADGNVYVDPPTVTGATKRLPRMNESVLNVASLPSLVPIDAVDPRTLNPAQPQGSGGSRFWYLRTTVPPSRLTPNAFAWKVFYAGKFHKQQRYRVTDGQPADTTAAASRKGPNPNLADPTQWAWRVYPTSGAGDRTAAAAMLGMYRNPISQPVAGPVTPYAAPTIPMQNSKPFTLFDAAAAGAYTVLAGDVDHPPFRFPYGSPFARNGDVLAVPFIGSYKVYRVPIRGERPNITMRGGNPLLYEYVPVTMDAVNVAPDSIEFAGGVAGTVVNPSVGRLDPRLTIRPANLWAADLFDFVTARQTLPVETRLPLSNEVKPTMQTPDVPALLTNAANPRNDPADPATDQDGPVQSMGPLQAGELASLTAVGGPPVLNETEGVRWTEYMADAAGSPVAKTPASNTRDPRKSIVIDEPARSLLIPGTINLNTAPPVVLRMLPWTVDPATGYLDQTPANAAVNEAMRLRVGIVQDRLYRAPTVPPPIAGRPDPLQGRLIAPATFPPFGLTTPMELASLPQIGKVGGVASGSDPRITDLYPTPPGTAGTVADRQELMRMGMLNPDFRPTPELDYNVAFLNANRVSNLTSQRSDVFTVYVTVQAWTWVGDVTGATQANDTRLVGERRSAFVVDRSRISQENLKLDSRRDIFPIEDE